LLYPLLWSLANTSLANSRSLQIVRQLRAVPATPSDFSIREKSFDRPTPSGAQK